MTVKKGNIFIVSAPSGCGKTTVVNGVINKTKGIARAITATSRLPRKGEKKNKDYYFLTEGVFKNKAKRGDFLEWTKTFGYYYGTPKKEVFNNLKKGNDAILVIDVKGAAQIKKKGIDCTLVFISPPSWAELVHRLKKRALDDSEDISIRLGVARKELAFSKKYDYLIMNKNLEEAIAKLRSIIIAKRCEIEKKPDKYRSG